MNRICVLALAMVAALAACGQKGALYLPDKGATVVTNPDPVSATGPAPSNKTDSEKDKVTPRPNQ